MADLYQQLGENMRHENMRHETYSQNNFHCQLENELKINDNFSIQDDSS